MSKTSNMINMVMYLSNGGIVKPKEISEYLEISKKYIIKN